MLDGTFTFRPFLYCLRFQTVQAISIFASHAIWFSALLRLVLWWIYIGQQPDNHERESRGNAFNFGLPKFTVQRSNN